MSQCISTAEQKHHHKSSPDAAAQSNDAIAPTTITQRYSPFCEYAVYIQAFPAVVHVLVSWQGRLREAEMLAFDSSS